jgi:glycosyltransferase involved in cell wall biosynthesis
MNAISIIMPCFNRAHDLVKVLKAYDSQSGVEPFELIAVDDGSSDATFDVLVSYRPQRYNLRAVRLDKNQGPAVARNHAVELVSSRLLVFVGDDMVPAPDLIQRHLEAHHIHPEKETAILGRAEWPADMPCNTLMRHIDGVGAQQFCYYYMRDGQEYDFRFFYTCNLSLKSEFVRSLDHWFDSDFYLAAFEDIELAYRLKRRGLHLIYSKRIVVQHYHYHNIWTFARRQRNAGLMANILIAKHPNLIFFFRKFYLPVLRLFRHPTDLMAPYSSDSLEQLETLACQLSGFYEWDANSLLDKLYLAVLEYYYNDGFIQGLFAFSKLQQRLRLANARRYLAFSLLSFLRNAESLGIPIPGGETALLAKKVNDLCLV